MDKSKGQIFLQRIIEGMFAIGLVLVFFFVLIMVFNAIFPEGSGLQFIFSERPNEEAATLRGQSDLQVARGDGADMLFGDDSWAATLSQVRNSVKSKKAGAIVWKSARRGIQLHNLDAVQTLDDSSAIIKFDDKNMIELGDNSLIVIRHMERDLLFKEKRSFMVIVDGELRGRIGGGDESGVYLEVSTPNAVARLKSDPNDAAGIEFKIDVLEDSASTITIYSGEGEVEAQGETVLLGKNQLTRVEGESVPTQPVTLPDPATILTPDRQAVFPYRNLPPRVKLSWKPQAKAVSYHLLLAMDQDFTEILIDKELTRPEFIHGNLREGDYFWKVSSSNFAGEGAFSLPRQFSLRQDQSPPDLEVQFPAETVQQQNVDIYGTTEPAARIYVSGVEVGLKPDGTFRHSIPLKRGINVVVVESVDLAGNISYRSRMINGKY